MESYIDFIKVYNPEKSISSTTDSDFNDFLKGGANNIKGGFPPIYMIDSASNSAREFSPSVDVSKILNNNKKNPFLNVSQDNVNGGFLKLFHSDKQSDNDDDANQSGGVSQPETGTSVENNVQVDDTIQTNGSGVSQPETGTSVENNVQVDDTIQTNGGVNSETTAALPTNLEIIDVAEELDMAEELDVAKELGTASESTEARPSSLEIINTQPPCQSGGNNKTIDNLFIRNIPRNNKNNISTSIDMPNELEIVSFGGAASATSTGLTETTIQLPENFDVLTDESSNFTESSIQLPSSFEVLTVTSPVTESDSNFTESSIELPNDLEIVSVTNTVPTTGPEKNIYAHIGGSNIDNIFLKQTKKSDIGLETSVDLPLNLEIVSVKQSGKTCSEHESEHKSEHELYGGSEETTIDLPDNLELLTID
jgi:hypothetical protein